MCFFVIVVVYNENLWECSWYWKEFGLFLLWGFVILFVWIFNVLVFLVRWLVFWWDGNLYFVIKCLCSEDELLILFVIFLFKDKVLLFFIIILGFFIERDFFVFVIFLVLEMWLIGLFLFGVNLLLYCFILEIFVLILFLRIGESCEFVFWLLSEVMFLVFFSNL